MKPESEFFRKQKFTPSEVAAFMKNADRDLAIASKDPYPEVRFMFAYQALIKTGIALLASEGLKVRSVPGHHIKILEKTGMILKDSDIETLGNAMRMKRNEDFYGEGSLIGEKESEEYLEFVRGVIGQVARMIET